MNPDELAQLIVSEVKSYTARAVADLETRLRSEFEERLKALPPALNGKDGIDGVDGKDGTPGAEGPQGVPGPSGERGEKGLDGQNGANGQDADLEIVRKEIRDEFVKVRAELDTVVKAIPVPKDGRDGRDAKDGKDGKDGIGRHEIHEAVEAALVKAIPGVVDVAVIETIKAMPPVMTYKDVWRPDLTYEPGHAVSHGGSLWHCNKQTTARPGEGSTDWTLAVKKGRDAKSPVVKA